MQRLDDALPALPAEERAGRWPAPLVAFAVLALAGAAAVSVLVADSDGPGDVASLSVRIATDSIHLRWAFAAVVVALAGMHYLAAALATRASVAVRLRLGETLLVQLAAAAANRLTPAGLGGSAVIARFLSRRGVGTPAAVGAVGLLAVLGAVADLLVLTALVFAGRLAGLGGGGHELTLLSSKLARVAAPLHSRWVWIAAGTVLAGACLVRAVLSRRGGGTRWRQILDPARTIAREPRRLLALLAASGATTLVLGFAFVASAAMVPGSQPQASVGALVVAFMAGSAAGNAVPVPAGIGSAELAFVGVLVAAQVPAGRALQIVIIFRLITFWFPAVVGVLATRHLRRLAAV